MNGFLSVCMRRVRWAGIFLLRRFALWDPVTGRRIPRNVMRNVGRGDGLWLVPAGIAETPGARVISAGVGLDASFDIALASAGADVVMLDPTPAARRYAEARAAEYPGLRFLPVGVWETSGPRVFHAPKSDRHVSHSITALQGERPAFTGECRTLADIAEELQWDRVDLVKLDIEGAEYKVLDQWLASGCPAARALCMEFDETHTPQDRDWRTRIRARVAGLESSGFRLAGVRGKGNYTFFQAGSGFDPNGHTRQAKQCRRL